MRRTTIMYLTLTVLAVTAIADVPPRVALTLLPNKTLPGLPVGFLLTITNPAAQPQVLANSVQLHVTTTAGSFEALGLRRDTTVGLPTDQVDRCGVAACLTIPAKGERQVYLRFGSLLGENEFLADRRLSAPGRYDFRITLLAGDPVRGPWMSVDSDTKTLVIEPAAGTDLMVWTYLQQMSGGKGWSGEDWIHLGDTVAREIRTTYPSSTYAVWVAGIGTLPTTSSSAKLAQLDTALRLDPPAPLRDELLLENARILHGLSDSALFADRDAEKALALAEQARAVYTKTRDVALTDYTRGHATDGLSRLLTRPTAIAEIRFLAEHDAPAPAAVIPRVECVQRGTGQSFTARFGYTNPNKTLKVLQIGADNQVTPAPRETGQPRVFKPGDHPNVFVASSPGGNLTWHLDGNKATATAEFGTPCTP